VWEMCGCAHQRHDGRTGTGNVEDLYEGVLLPRGCGQSGSMIRHFDFTHPSTFLGQYSAADALVSSSEE